VLDQREPKFIADGDELKELARASLTWLRHHQESINALNVFPVPDGDTGTNMVLTMQSACKEVADCTERDVGPVAHKIAHGALMGARGNSGVILSQIWRGLARGLDERAVFNAADLASALQEAATTAYKGVIRPVEGTILTVIREVAEESQLAAGDSEDLIYMLERMVQRAADAVIRTPTLLAVLAEAGVVDAGGQGLYVILEGMLRRLRGEVVTEEALAVPAVGLSLPMVPHTHEAQYGYDVQFMVTGQELDVAAIREQIDAMGDSTLVVGDPTTVKVHVHVEDPGVPLSYASGLGSLRDVVVEDMQAQYQEFITAQERPPALIVSSAPLDIAPVAVVAGDGLARVFESLGAAAIVHGGQTMNPSTEEILKAIETVPSDQVIVLPNNKNIILAAEQARDLSDKEVVVVPTRTIPQGIAAILALNHQADLACNAEAMKTAMQEVRTGEVTTATRDVQIGGVSVQNGQLIGLCDDELVLAGDTPEGVVQRLLERMDPSNLEIVTLYYGSDVTAAEGQALADELQEAYPDLEFEVVEGGQPYYFYIVSAE
jgi:DAK2 domain fusion protein YloV